MQSGREVQFGPVLRRSAQERLAALKVQEKELREQMKAAKAALPKASPLDRVRAAQARQRVKWLDERIGRRIVDRVKAGQDRAEATQEVLEAEWRA